jgi:RHS repeat-associated protein
LALSYSAEDCATHNPYQQNHKYKGKEFDTTHGLNTYDYGARQYNSLVGRLDRMDPQCEKYYSVCPYAYCRNNPIIRIDVDGLYDTLNIHKGENYPVIVVLQTNSFRWVPL